MSKQHTEAMRKEMTPVERAMEQGRLRDEFAKEALCGSLAHPNNSGTPNEHATWAYQAADAMLEARLK